MSTPLVPCLLDTLQGSVYRSLVSLVLDLGPGDRGLENKNWWKEIDEVYTPFDSESLVSVNKYQCGSSRRVF